MDVTPDFLRAKYDEVELLDRGAHGRVYKCTRAGVTIAISTDGHAPALAGLIREALERLLPNELDAWMDCARQARRRWLAAGVPMAERRPLLLNALVELYDRQPVGARQ